jgi:phosphoenolpyruvate---glycerone phosphotransferase subunit DhaK
MAMKKLINKPEDIVKELLTGLVNAHSDLLRLTENDIVVRRQPKDKGKVYLVFGQGVGHEPAFDGLVGYGMHDVEVPGGIFTCAGGEKIYQGIKLAWEMSGHTPVLELVANHEGDVINAGIALEMAREDNIDVESVILYDDIASAPKGQEDKRRGMAGQLFSFKVAGAMAEAGEPRDEIIRKVREVNASTRTLAVALRPCTIPTTGQLLFSLAEDEIIIGPGVHGEAGPEGPIKLPSANEVIEIVAERVIQDGGFASGDEVLVLINGSGATTLMEMFILFNRLEEVLKSRNMKVYRPLIGNYVTTQEMAGFSLSMCKADEETKRYWDARTITPYLKVVID